MSASEGHTARKIYERLTNLCLRTIRHSKAYDVTVLDLYYAGVLVKKTAESLLGYSIPSHLKPPRGLVPQNNSSLPPMPPLPPYGGHEGPHGDIDPNIGLEVSSRRYVTKTACSETVNGLSKVINNLRDDINSNNTAIDGLRNDVSSNTTAIDNLQSVLYETVTVDGDTLAKPVSIIFSAIRCSINVVDYAVIFKSTLINKGSTDNIRIGTLNTTLRPAHSATIPIFSMGNTNIINYVTIDTQGVITLAYRLADERNYTAPVVRGYSA
jgi:hypothetical protein